MFCPKCGAKVIDGSAFCGMCGNPLTPPDSTAGQPSGAVQPAQTAASEAQTQNTGSYNADSVSAQPDYNSNPAQTQTSYMPDYSDYNSGNTSEPHTEGFSKKNKIILGIVAAAAAVAVIIILVLVLGGGLSKYTTNSPEATVSKFESALNDNLNLDEIMDCIDFESDTDYTDLSSSIQYIVSLAESFGLTYSFDFEVDDIEYYSSNGNQYADVDLDIEVFASYMGESDTSSASFDATMILVDNEWKFSSDDNFLSSLFSSW